MSWKAVFLIALAVGQVPAKSIQHVEVEYVENYVPKDGRIVSGWEAAAGQHPHHAALRTVNAAGGVGMCGGSVVHRNWVITAAHCTARRVSVVVLAGVVHLATPQYISETTEWYNHPTYNELSSRVQPNDISILKLTTPVTYTNELRAIRIQSRADATRNYNRVVLQTSGHGRTWTNGETSDVLRWVYLRGISNTACSLVYGLIITRATVCARYYNVTSQSICQGDGGGPLVHVRADGEPVLVGVTSFGSTGIFGCHSGRPVGFTRPGQFHSWFTQITGIDFENLVEEEEPPVTEPEPEEEVTEVPDPENEVTETPKPENEVTKVPDPEDEVPETPEPEYDVTETPESEVKVTETPKPEDEVTEAPQPEDKVTETPEPEDKVTETPEPEDEVSEVPDPEDDVTEVPDTEDEVPETPEPEYEVTETPEAEDKATETPVPEVEVTKVPDPENEVTGSPESEDEVTEVPKHEEEVTETPESEDKVTETPESEDKVTETPESEDKITETPEPEDEVTGTPEPEDEVTQTPKPEDETTEAPEPEEDEDDDSGQDDADSGQDDDDSGSSESEEDDPELSELLKRLEVKVKVKVKMSKHGKHKEIHHHSNKTIIHHGRS